MLIPAFTNSFRSFVQQITVVNRFNGKIFFFETWLTLIWWNCIIDFFFENLHFYFGCWFFKPHLYFESSVLDIVAMFKISSVLYLFVFMWYNIFYLDILWIYSVVDTFKSMFYFPLILQDPFGTTASLNFYISIPLKI